MRKKFGGIKKSAYLCNRLQEARALSSVGLEHLPYKQWVGGSNPSAPTGVFSSQSLVVAGNFFCSSDMWSDAPPPQVRTQFQPNIHLVSAKHIICFSQTHCFFCYGGLYGFFVQPRLNGRRR